MEKIIDKLVNLGIDVGFKLLYVIVILLVGFKLIGWSVNLLKKSRLFKRIDRSLASFVLSFIKILLYVILFMTCASILGIPLTSMITVLGSAGLAVGLALQGGLSNIAGGIIILLFKPFQVGDFVDTHADSGTVRSINLFYTVLVTPDNKVISIPNGNLANQPTVNYSKEETRRLDIDFALSYKNDLESVKKVLNDIVKSDQRIINEEGKRPFIGITNYLDSSIIYTVRVWVKSGDFWDLKTYLLEEGKKAFAKNKIEVPHSQLDVRVEK